MAPNPNSGRAYAFFNCRQSKSDVEWIAKDVRGMFAQQVPLLEQMTLRVNQGLTFLTARGRMIEARSELLKVVLNAEKGGALCLEPKPLAFVSPALVVRSDDSVLAAIAVQFHDFGSIYAIRASLPKTPNRAVADELAPIMNQIYQSPLYYEGEPFRGIIAYFENGSYMLRK
jgi:hypothetical protein